MSAEEESKDMVGTIISGLFQLGVTIWREVAARKNATEEQRKQNEERSRAAFERMRNAVLAFEDALDENDRQADALLASVMKKFDTSDVPTVSGPAPEIIR